MQCMQTKVAVFTPASSASCRASSGTGTGYYVLIAIVRNELQIEALMYTYLKILSVSVFEQNQLSCAFPGDQSTTEQADDAQLNSFNF